MTHIHWVTRQNKLEIPVDKDDVNKREIRECDGRAHDPDTMVALNEMLYFFIKFHENFFGKKRQKMIENAERSFILDR
jgi:hypothetical protein